MPGLPAFTHIYVDQNYVPSSNTFTLINMWNVQICSYQWGNAILRLLMHSPLRSAGRIGGIVHVRVALGIQCVHYCQFDNLCGYFRGPLLGMPHSPRDRSACFCEQNELYWQFVIFLLNRNLILVTGSLNLYEMTVLV